MANVYAVVALRALHRPIVNSEGHSITRSERHDLDAALHAWPLFGKGELAACEIRAGFREENRGLDPKCEIAIDVPMEAVEVTGDMLQEKRRRACLAGVVAPLEE